MLQAGGQFTGALLTSTTERDKRTEVDLDHVTGGGGGERADSEARQSAPAFGGAPLQQPLRGTPHAQADWHHQAQHLKTQAFRCEENRDHPADGCQGGECTELFHHSMAKCFCAITHREQHQSHALD